MDPTPIANNIIAQLAAIGILIVGEGLIIWALWRFILSLWADQKTERKEQRDVEKETTSAINKLAAVIEAGQRGRP